MNERLPRSRWLTCLVLGTVAWIPSSLPAQADDVRVNQLTLDVQALQRKVGEQGRRIDELERELARFRQPGVGQPAGRSSPAQPASQQWLQRRNWDRLKPGMTGQEVIEILGTPASVRATDGRRTLFYAMQLGASGHLAGSVALENDGVVTIERPVLK